MSRFKILVLALTALIPGCSFQFNNPVEECYGAHCGFDAGSPSTGTPDAGASISMDPRWTTEVVAEVPVDDVWESGLSFRWISAGFTPDNQPVVAFSFDAKAYVGFKQGEEWRADIISEGLVLARGHVVVTGSDPSVVYDDGSTIRFYEKKGGDWYRYRLLDRPGDGCLPYTQCVLTSSAVRGPRGGVHVVDVWGGALRHSVWNEDRTDVRVASDEIAKVDPSTWDTAIQSDGAGRMHAFYRDFKSGETIYAVQRDDAWAVEPVLTASEELRQTAVFGMADGSPVLCYADEGAKLGTERVRCRRRDADVWATSDVAESRSPEYAAVLAVAPNGLGGIHLVMVNGAPASSPTQKLGRESLVYARTKDGGWELIPVFDQAADTRSLYAAAIVLDRDGRPAVFFALDRTLYMARLKR